MDDFLIDEYGREYYDSLPDNYTKLNKFKDLFEKINPNEPMTVENARLIRGLEFLIYDDKLDIYLHKVLIRTYPRPILYQYFKEGILYVKKELVEVPVQKPSSLF
jgi:hypothetical protein